MVSYVKGHKSVFFVEVQDHLTLRRNTLQCLRDILDSLQKFHDFQRLKEQKTRKVSELRTAVNRTNMLLLKLRTALPEATFTEPKQPKMKMAKVEDMPSLVQQAPAEAVARQPKPRSELDMLEAELAAIEKKLNKLV